MAYTYLPKNKLDGTVTLDKIALEFAATSLGPFSNSIKCEETLISKITSICTGTTSPLIIPNGICWGGENGQYLFIATPNIIYRIETSTDRPVGITSDYHWNSDFDLISDGTSSSRVIGTGSTTGSVENNAQGITFNPAGTICLIVGDGNSISEYSLSTAWDLSTLTYVRKFSLTNRKIKEYSPTDLCYSDNGDKLFVIGAFKDRVHILNLQTPYSLAGSVYNTYFDLINAVGGKLIEFPSSIAFSDGGKRMYVSGYISPLIGKIFQYELNIAFNPTTAVYGNEYDISSYENNPLSIVFSKFGTVKNHPDGGIDTLYDIKDNLIIAGASKFFTLELPIASYTKPISLNDFYRGKTYIPIEVSGPLLNIPKEFDQSKISGFSDSISEKTFLEYIDSVGQSPYKTYGVDFSFNGDYAFVNRVDSNITDIIRIPTSSKNLNLFDYDSSLRQSFSIAGQKLGGNTIEAILNKWNTFSHAGLKYPASLEDADDSYWVQQTTPEGPNFIDGLFRSGPNTTTFYGLISDIKLNQYSLSSYISAATTSSAPIGVVAAFGDEYTSTLSEVSYPVDYSPYNVLFYYAGTNSAIITGIGNIATSLENNGYTVSSVTTLPADLSAYQQVWDFNYENAALDSNIATQYSGVLQRGGFVYLAGENANFPLRNNSIINYAKSLSGIYMSTVSTVTTSSLNVNSSYITSVTSIETNGPGRVSSGATPIAWSGSEYLGSASIYTLFGNQMYSQYTGTLTLAFDINIIASYAINSDFFIDAANNIGNSTITDTIYFEPTLSAERFLSSSYYNNIPIIVDLSTLYSGNYTQPNKPTFAISLNSNKLAAIGDNFNVSDTVLIKGPIGNDILQSEPTVYRWGDNEAYTEVKKEGNEICIFMSPISYEEGIGTPTLQSINHYPGGIRDGEWDWKNLTPAAGVTNLKGLAYYINTETGYYKYKDFGITAVNGSGTITDSNILNSLSLLTDDVKYGVSAFYNSVPLYNLAINGTNISTNLNLYSDKFATHKIGKGGYKVFTAVNTFDSVDSLFTSQILSYDLLTSYNLENASFSKEILYTHNATNLANGQINSFDFGKDSFGVEGKVLYTLSDLTNDTNIIDQYSLSTSWNVASAIKQYSKTINNLDIGFKPTLMSLTNDGSNIIFAGNSNKLKMGSLSNPFLISTLTFNNDSSSEFITPLNIIKTLWVSNDFSQLIVGDSDSNGLFKFENVGFKNPISFSNFFDSI